MARSQFGNLGFEIVDTLTGFVDGIGDNFTNKADADAAKIRYINAQTSIAASTAAADAERKAKITSAIITLVYLIAIAAAVLVVSKQMKR